MLESPVININGKRYDVAQKLSFFTAHKYAC